MLPVVLATMFVVVGQTADKSDGIPRLALEVLNSARTGRQVFLFEHTVGPEAREVGGEKPAKLLLTYSAILGDCPGCQKDIARLEKIAEKAKSGGGLVAVVILGRPEDRQKARARFGNQAGSLLFLFDGHGLARKRLGLVGPRWAVIFGANGQRLGLFAPMDGGLASASKAFMKQLTEEAR